MKLHEILVKSAHAAVPYQRSDGAMPPGHNGPWQTPETPVRNTGHWLLTFLKAHEWSGDAVFRSAAEAAAEYLLQPNHRPHGAVFFHREVANGDCGNGLIGQAWSIEALLVAGTCLGREEMLRLAERCFLTHKQDGATGLWCSASIGGKPGGICRTFNQQLWFAAVGAALADASGSGEIARRTEHGMRGLASCAGTYRYGLFQHLLRVPLHWAGRCPGYAVADAAARYLLRRRHTPRQIELAIGYHSFCLYALAMLKSVRPGHPLWGRRAVRMALGALESPEYGEAIKRNSFAYSYNLTGIENAYALSVFFPQQRDRCRWWLQEQLNRTFDPDAGLLSKGAGDPATAAARLYEATRLPEIEVNVNVSGEQPDRRSRQPLAEPRPAIHARI